LFYFFFCLPENHFLFANTPHLRSAFRFVLSSPPGTYRDFLLLFDELVMLSPLFRKGSPFLETPSMPPPRPLCSPTFSPSPHSPENAHSLTKPVSLCTESPPFFSFFSFPLFSSSPFAPRVSRSFPSGKGKHLLFLSASPRLTYVFFLGGGSIPPPSKTFFLFCGQTPLSFCGHFPDGLRPPEPPYSKGFFLSNSRCSPTSLSFHPDFMGPLVRRPHGKTPLFFTG